MLQIHFVDADSGHLRAVLGRGKNRRFVRLGNADTVARALYLLKAEDNVIEALRILGALYRNDPTYYLRLLEGTRRESEREVRREDGKCIELTDRILELFLDSRRGDSEKPRYISILRQLFAPGPICSISDLEKRTKDWSRDRKGRAKRFFNWLKDTALVELTLEQRKLAAAIAELLPSRNYSRTRAPDAPPDDVVLEWARRVRKDGDPVLKAVWNCLVTTGGRFEQVIRAAQHAENLPVLYETEHLVVIYIEPITKGKKRTIYITVPKHDWQILAKTKPKLSTMKDAFYNNLNIQPGRLRGWQDSKVIITAIERLRERHRDYALIHAMDIKTLSDIIHGHVSGVAVRHYQLKALAQIAGDAIEEVYPELSRFFA